MALHTVLLFALFTVCVAVDSQLSCEFSGRVAFVEIEGLVPTGLLSCVVNIIPATVRFLVICKGHWGGRDNKKCLNINEQNLHDCWV